MRVFGFRPFAPTVVRLLRGSVLGLGVVTACLTELGCTVAESANLGAEEQGGNHCDATSCEVGLCVDGLCQARTTELDSLIVEVGFPSGLSIVPGQKFVTVLDGVGSGDGLVDVQLGNVSRVVGAIRGAPISSPSCVPLREGEAPSIEADGSFPARVSILPRTRLLGLNAPIAVVDSSSDGSSNVFSATVSPGAYDFYVEPSGSDVGCLRPPYLVVNQLVKPGDLELKLTLPEPKPLSLVVEFVGEDAALDGFEVAVVDGATGRVLSNVGTLGEPEWIDSVARYGTSLVYTSVQGSLSSKVHELVRLSPPSGVEFPSLFIERAVAELFQPGTATINQVLEIPKPIVVRGSLGAASGASDGTRLVFAAAEFPFVAAGTLFSYVRETEVDEAGDFEIELLPGKYRILVEPLEAARAQTTLERTFDESVSGVELPTGEMVPLSSRAFSARETALSRVPFEVTPVLSPNGFAELLTPTLVPRSFEGSTDSEGVFSALLDPGEYVVTFRPDAESGLPWLVLPNVRLSGGAVSVLNPVGSLPVVLRGRVIAADAGEVPSATLRFYALMNGDALAESIDSATRAVPVAEARANEEGYYRALLPSRMASEPTSVPK